MMQIIKISLIGVFMVNVSVAQTYITDFCLCQLDQHLLQVRKDLAANKSYPPTPIPPPLTTTVEPTSTTSLTENTTSSDNVTTTETPSTQAENTTLSENATTTEIPATQKRRKKREISEITDEKRHESRGVVGPKRRVAYNKGVALVDDVGVLYSEMYNASLCSCRNGSVATLSLCFVNIRNNDSGFDDITSEVSRSHLKRLLPWIDAIFRNSLAFKEHYKRTIPLKFSNFSGHLQIHFEVTLNERLYSPVYHVKTGFESPEVRQGEIKIQGVLYETDIDDEKCYFIQDVTPPIIKEKTLLDSLRYVLLLVAFVILVLICLISCCGKRDSFYVRFW